MARTRRQRQEDTSPTCNVLDFVHDEDSGCALTVLVKDTRYHITVDYDELAGDHRHEYLARLQAARGKDPQDGVPVERHVSRKRKRSSEDNEKEAEDSGYGSSPPGPESGETVPGLEKETGADIVQDGDVEDAENELYSWILQPLGNIFASTPLVEKKEKARTLHDWFHSPARFFRLVISKQDEIQPEELEETPELQHRIDNLKPDLKLPKYILDHDIPRFLASDLEILETGDAPLPIHPTVVRSRSDNVTYFLKLVDRNQPGPTKRELKIMKDIERKGIHQEIRVPLVKGLVIDCEGMTPIMGFLQTPILDPTPLTVMLDTDVAEEKRESWASEASRMVDVLHKNGIVWGDAKADNFMVDKDARLWIIDFGGSYTEGWIDPELAETEEGDDMGVEKVVHALEDPEAGTFDPEEEAPNARKKVRFDEAV